MPLRAVTFDFHNTLATCDEWFQIEVRELVPRFIQWYAQNVDTPPSSATHERAASVYRALRVEIIEHGVERDAYECTRHVLRELGVEVTDGEIREGVDAIMRAALRRCFPVPGAVEAIRDLRSRGLALAVVSSAVHHAFLEWSLDRFGILDAFDVVVTSASAGFYKSRPEIYLHALERLNVGPNDALHVGDSYLYDVEGAGRAGMRAVWYTNGNREGGGAGAALTVSTLEGLAPMIIERFACAP